MKKFLCIFWITLLLGCGKSPKEQIKDKRDAGLKEQILSFSKENKASFKWVKDISQLEDKVLTAHFQNLFLSDTESLFIFPLEIIDVAQRDNGFVVIGNASYFLYYNMSLILNCPSDIAEIILKGELGNQFDTLLVAATISSVKSFTLELNTEIDGYENEVWTNIYIDAVDTPRIVLVGECKALEKVGDYFDFEGLAIELSNSNEDVEQN